MQIKPHGPHQPRQRVGAKETERADEQAGHGKEHNVEQRVIRLVQRIGVRLVIGELARGTRVTFLAGRQDVVRRKVRGGIGHRQDIMEAVAIVARGHLGRVIGFAEHHGLAVIGLAIMFEAVRMALAAALVAEGFEIFARGIHDLMRAVAINADRSARIALGQQLAVDALVVSLLDADVALAAGLGHVRVVDGRVAVNVALDLMRAVTVVAGRRHDEAHLQQRLAVDAVHVLIRGLGKLDLIFLGEVGVAVALGAGGGQIHFEHGGIRVLHRHDLVVAVAIPTLRRAGSAHLVAHAVNAAGVVLAFLLMAAGTIRRRRIFVVLHLLDAVMAINAVQRAVDGFGKTIRRKQRHGDGMAVDHFLVGGIGVAIETVGAFQLVRREDQRGGEEKKQREPGDPEKCAKRCAWHTVTQSRQTPPPACQGLRFIRLFLAEKIMHIAGLVRKTDRQNRNPPEKTAGPLVTINRDRRKITDRVV